jgi:hypothetical protein
MNWQRKGIRRNSSVEIVTALDLNRIVSRVHPLFSEQRNRKIFFPDLNEAKLHKFEVKQKRNEATTNGSGK